MIRSLPLLAGLAIVGLVAFPFVGSSYAVSILTVILIYAAFAMSLDLLLGYTGLASFGHAAFLGIGAYSVGLFSVHVSDSFWLTLPLALVASGLASLLIGFVAIRSGSVYFLMLTLAFSQLLYALAVSFDFAGGANGLPGIPPPSLSPLPWEDIFSNRTSFYYLTLALLLFSVWMIRTLINAPFGRALIGIRENEPRMRALGYATERYKLAAFVIAGMLAGASGAFYAYHRGFVSPEILFWTMSGMAIVMVIIGGAGTLLGPIVGAGVYTLLEDVVSSHTDRWQLILGVTFLVFVFVLRDGIVGKTHQLLGHRR